MIQSDLSRTILVRLQSFPKAGDLLMLLFLLVVLRDVPSVKGERLGITLKKFPGERIFGYFREVKSLLESFRVLLERFTIL